MVCMTGPSTDSPSACIRVISPVALETPARHAGAPRGRARAPQLACAETAVRGDCVVSSLEENVSAARPRGRWLSARPPVPRRVPLGVQSAQPAPSFLLGDTGGPPAPPPSPPQRFWLLPSAPATSA